MSTALHRLQEQSSEKIFSEEEKRRPEIYICASQARKRKESLQLLIWIQFQLCLEFEYLHRNSRCEVLIGGDYISNDVTFTYVMRWLAEIWQLCRRARGPVSGVRIEECGTKEEKTSFPGFSPTRPTERERESSLSLRRAGRREPWERGWGREREKN